MTITRSSKTLVQTPLPSGPSLPKFLPALVASKTFRHAAAIVKKYNPSIGGAAPAFTLTSILTLPLTDGSHPADKGSITMFGLKCAGGYLFCGLMKPDPKAYDLASLRIQGTPNGVHLTIYQDPKGRFAKAFDLVNGAVILKQLTAYDLPPLSLSSRNGSSLSIEGPKNGILGAFLACPEETIFSPWYDCPDIVSSGAYNTRTIAVPKSSSRGMTNQP